MTTTIIRRINLKDLEATLSRSTPVLAVVGAGDLAFEKLLAAREELTDRAAAFDPKAFRDQAQGTISDRVGALQTAPDQLRALPEKAQEWPTKAQSLLADLVSAAFATYGELVGRGTHRVTQVRQQAPEAVDVEVDITPVSRPKTSPAKKATAPATSTAKRSTTKSSASSADKPSSTSSAAKKASKTPAADSSAADSSAASSAAASDSGPAASVTDAPSSSS